MKTACISVLMLLSLSLEANEDKYIKDALLKYNYGIIKMGKTGETQFFKEIVSKDVAMKLQVWFESWKFSNLTFVAQINDLRFSPIAYNEHNATIRTLENWSYTYVNLVTREIALEPEKIFYKMHYTLAKHDGKWKIVAVKHLEEELFTKPNTHRVDLNTTKEIIEDNQNSGITKANIPTH